MALIKCHECGNDVSTEAAACPKCGAKPKKSVPPSNIGAAIIVIAIVIFAIAKCSSGDNEKDVKKEAEVACAKDDLSCLGDKGVVGASVYCQREIEKLATHIVKWTDSTFELKFSRYRWKNQPAGIITYIGDKAEFQNGFGAFTPMIYECNLMSDNKTVVDVQASEGRLP